MKFERPAYDPGEVIAFAETDWELQTCTEVWAGGRKNYQVTDEEHVYYYSDVNEALNDFYDRLEKL